jgi:hypothetical protein
MSAAATGAERARPGEILRAKYLVLVETANNSVRKVSDIKRCGLRKYSSYAPLFPFVVLSAAG